METPLLAVLCSCSSIPGPLPGCSEAVVVEEVAAFLTPAARGHGGGFLTCCTLEVLHPRAAAMWQLPGALVQGAFPGGPCRALTAILKSSTSLSQVPSCSSSGFCVLRRALVGAGAHCACPLGEAVSGVLRSLQGAQK